MAANVGKENPDLHFAMPILTYHNNDAIASKRADIPMTPLTGRTFGDVSNAYSATPLQSGVKSSGKLGSSVNRLVFAPSPAPPKPQKEADLFRKVEIVVEPPMREEELPEPETIPYFKEDVDEVERVMEDIEDGILSLISRVDRRRRYHTHVDDYDIILAEPAFNFWSPISSPEPISDDMIDF